MGVLEEGHNGHLWRTGPWAVDGESEHTREGAGCHWDFLRKMLESQNCIFSTPTQLTDGLV